MVGFDSLGLIGGFRGFNLGFVVLFAFVVLGGGGGGGGGGHAHTLVSLLLFVEFVVLYCSGKLM